MNKPFTLVFCFLISGLAACTPKHAITKEIVNEPVVKDIAMLNNQLKAHALVYNWLDIQGEMTYDDGSNTVTANLNIRNRKDSIVWASANVLIEAARVLVNKDSATIMNRLQKNYAVFPVSDLNRLLGINNLDLYALQNLLQGIPPFGFDANSKMSFQNGNYSIQNQQSTYREDIQLQKQTLRLTQYRYQRNATEYVLINFSDYKSIGDHSFPNKIDMEVRTPDKIHIILKVSDYSLQDTDDASFNIPLSYSKVK